MKPYSLKIHNNEAYLNNHKITDLANKYQTPLYVIDEKGVRKACLDFQTFFKSDKFKSTIVYASKAFLVPKMATLVDEYGFYMDAVSLGDLYVASFANFPMKKIVFHGNNKQTDELIYALDKGVGLIVVDNISELLELASLCLERKQSQNILIRINPGIDAHTHKYIQTAKLTSKFGESLYDEKVIDQMMKIIKNSSYLKLLGFHAHIGSQIHEMDAYFLEIDKMVIFQSEIAEKYQLDLPTLNIGGGFGIKYTIDEENRTIKEMMLAITKKLEQALKNTLIKEIMIEPGRAIIGPNGITLYECSKIKHTYGGKNYLFIDGGMTDNIRPSLYGALYECDIATKMMNKKELLVDVAGKCCESGDIIRSNVLVPNVDKGDILIVYATGAYNYSMASNYNNLLKPAVILVGDEVEIISRRQTLKDLTNLF